MTEYCVLQFEYYFNLLKNNLVNEKRSHELSVLAEFRRKHYLFEYKPENTLILYIFFNTF
jgi:hypothetical protein